MGQISKEKSAGKLNYNSSNKQPFARFGPGTASMHGHPTVLWTGNGYHIHQPMAGFILEEEEVFAKFIDPTGKDLTSKFMQFAEDFLTNKKGDRQHRPSINSCLVRIPGTLNSKCAQEVKIIQRWDGQRSAINHLLRDFRRWLINEKMRQRLIDSKRGAHSDC